METSVSGLPVIFVPLPWGNGEQGRNAAGLVQAGGGWLVEDAALTPDKLGALVTEAFADPARLAHMAETCRGMYPSDAAERLARAVLEAAGRKGN
jgi:UDP-N-acetylglucosamine--N-acetylmuramyl-(pentapeptide) pyrophosphoryl-undecaprenol N-acetylglucosamine transferase